MIKYVTDKENDSNVDLIQRVLKDIGLSYSLSSIEYNKQRQRIDYK